MGKIFVGNLVKNLLKIFRDETRVDIDTFTRWFVTLVTVNNAPRSETPSASFRPP